VLAHPVLDVDATVLIAGERGVEPGEHPVATHLLQLVAVEEVGGGVAVAEEQPVPARVATERPVPREAAERRDARARSDFQIGADHEEARRRRSPASSR